MATITPVSVNSVIARLSEAATASSRAPKTAAQAAAASSAPSLDAKKGAELVGKAAANATKSFTALDSLRQELAAASRKSDLGKDEIKALNDKVVALRKEVDQQAADAKVGDANLLASGSSGATVTTAAGDKATVAARPLDSKALGLDKLEITDSQSLRQAAGQLALATGQAQTAVLNFEAAKGVVAPTSTQNAAVTAFDKAQAARDAAPKAGSAADSLNKAIDSQRAANVAAYGSAGRPARGPARTGGILDLFA